MLLSSWIVAGLRRAMVIGVLLATGSAAAAAPEWRYRVIAEYPHDSSAFTEGLTLLDAQLLESTGLRGHSTLCLRELTTSLPINCARLDDDDFGEGTTVVGDHIVQLTWRSGIGFVYDRQLQLLGSFPLDGEGWGLTFDGTQMIRSDGSDSLHFVSAETYQDTRSIAVRDGALRVFQLNELEYARGMIFANVWHSDRIAAISPADGKVLGWIDLGGLQRRLSKPPSWNPIDDVLNGIAYNPANGHFYVTGKHWPKLFEIAIDAPSDR